MANKKNLYTEDSIQSLDPREFTRLKPQVYCGSTEYSTQLLVEIVSNSIDEVMLGHGNKIEINANLESGKVKVRDYGQGFLVNSVRPEDGKTVLEAAFSVLNTSGKYSADGVYEGTSLGNFGIGSKLPVFLSTKAEVTTYRDGEYEHLIFKDGILDKRKVGKTKELNGTEVSWTPDKQFFKNIQIDEKMIIPYLKTLTCLIDKLEIIYNDKNYKSENGLDDLVSEAVGDEEIISNRLKIKGQEGKSKMNLILTYTSKYSSTIVPYVNTGLTDSGPHITQLKTVITREFNKLLKDKGWLKEKEENLSGDDIQEGMYLVFNLTSQGVAYDAQVKSRLTQIDMKPFIQMLSDNLQIWFAQNEKEVKLIADKALAARRAREAAKKARDTARNLNTKSKSNFINLPSKLVDSWSKKREKCEILIAEGDSAAGGLIGARDGEFQAIFPIRGKILNLYKATNEKTFANQEIVNIIKALGLDFDKNKNKLIYDENKLRYGKIIMCADADSDGLSIRNLILTALWSLCPDLITKGHVYAALPPLFRITTKKNEYIYLKDAEELENYKKAHNGEKFLINRNKGLGEQDAEELEECLLNPKTRNIAQITVNDMTEAAKLFEIFMGPAVPPRREWILEHSEEANIL